MATTAKIASRYDVTTLLGSHLGLSMLLPVGYNPMKEFTLNSLLNVHPNEDITEMPKLRYCGIGIRGCYNADDDILATPYNPRRSNMNLYRPIPIRCRPVDEDLTEHERAQYRMRQRTVLNGEEVFLYWLKVINFSNEIKYKRINAINGKEENIELDRANLNPEPVKVSDLTTVDASANAQIVAYCEASVNITANEVLEYITRKYEGDTRYARISEVGFFTGVDKVVSGMTGQNIPINYTEALNCHLYDHSTWTGSCLSSAGEFIDSKWEICSNGAITYK